MEGLIATQKTRIQTEEEAKKAQDASEASEKNAKVSKSNLETSNKLAEEAKAA